MATASDFYKLTRLHVPGCPTPILDDAILRSAEELCEKAMVWRAWLASVTTTNADRTYTLSALSGARIVKVHQLLLAGKELAPYSPDEAMAHGIEYFEAADVTEEAYVMTSPEDIMLLKNPGDGAALRAYVQMAPDTALTNLPASVVRAWERGISAGALSRLFEMEGETWYRPNRIGPERAKFEEAIGDARSAMAHAFGRGRVRANPAWC